MKIKHLFLLLYLLPLTVLAQYTSTGGRFRVDEKKGCVPLTVTILDTNLITVGQCTGANPCDMTWGDGGAVQQNVFTHTYTQAGTYKLKILYQTIGTDEIDITVTPNIPPVFEVYTCGNRQVQVKVTDTNYDAYIINYNDATAEVMVPKGTLAVDTHTYGTTGAKTVSVRGKNVNADDNCTPPATTSVNVVNALTAPLLDLLTVSSSTQVDLEFNNAFYSNNVIYKLEIAQNSSANGSFQLTAVTFLNSSAGSIPNLRTDDVYYCFRLGAFDPCLNTTVRSNIVCSANFDVTPQNSLNSLAWTSSTTGVTNFTVNRDGSLIGSTGGLTLTDSKVVCNTDYCYQILTNYANGSQSISLDKCVTAFSTNVPTVIGNVTAVVGSGAVDLTWFQDPAFQAAEYTVFRKSGGGSFNTLSKTSTTGLQDAEYTTSGDYCYRVDYADACGNESPDGVEVCPIRLSGKVNADNSFDLTWTAYNGWINGVNHYVVEKYDEEGVLLQVFNVGTATTFTDNAIDPLNQKYMFIVTAEPNDSGLGISISNEISLTKEPNIYYPKAFTPNGDNLNDVFLVFGQYVTKFEMNIFNRWGELLFTTTNLEAGWDGKYKGTTQPEGTYAFVAKITDETGRIFDRSGSFVLLRK